MAVMSDTNVYFLGCVVDKKKMTGEGSTEQAGRAGAAHEHFSTPGDRSDEEDRRFSSFDAH